MAVKKWWFRGQEYTVSTSQKNKSTLISLTTPDGKTKEIIAQNIMWNQTINALFFSVNAVHYKVYLTQQDSTTNTNEKLHAHLANTHHHIDLHYQNPHHKEKIIPALKATLQDTLRSPLTGTVLRILAHEQQKVIKNQLLLIIESMKMENEIRASHDTFIKTIPIRELDVVESGQVVMTFSSKGEHDHAISKGADGQKKVQNW